MRTQLAGEEDGGTGSPPPRGRRAGMPCPPGRCPPRAPGRRGRATGASGVTSRCTPRTTSASDQSARKPATPSPPGQRSRPAAAVRQHGIPPPADQRRVRRGAGPLAQQVVQAPATTTSRAATAAKAAPTSGAGAGRSALSSSAVAGTESTVSAARATRPPGLRYACALGRPGAGGVVPAEAGSGGRRGHLASVARCRRRVCPGDDPRALDPTAPRDRARRSLGPTSLPGPRPPTSPGRRPLDGSRRATPPHRPVAPTCGRFGRSTPRVWSGPSGWSIHSMSPSRIQNRRSASRASPPAPRPWPSPGSSTLPPPPPRPPRASSATASPAATRPAPPSSVDPGHPADRGPGEPVAAPGSGLGKPLQVRWEVARDEGFRHVVAKGHVQTSADSDHTVKVDVTGLKPYTRYHYRFESRGERSPVGQHPHRARRRRRGARPAVRAGQLQQLHRRLLHGLPGDRAARRPRPRAARRRLHLRVRQRRRPLRPRRPRSACATARPRPRPSTSRATGCGTRCTRPTPTRRPRTGAAVDHDLRRPRGRQQRLGQRRREPPGRRGRLPRASARRRCRPTWSGCRSGCPTSRCRTRARASSSGSPSAPSATCRSSRPGRTAASR